MKVCVCLLQACAVYYGVAVLLHFVVPKVITIKYLQPSKTQSASDIKRDALRSFLPLVIKGASLYAAEMMHRSGYGVLRDVSIFPMVQNITKDPRDLISVILLWFLMDLFHDAWFYFVHRILHTKWIFR